jgi:hypothetical protein
VFNPRCVLWHRVALLVCFQFSINHSFANSVACLEFLAWIKEGRGINFPVKVVPV